MNILVTGGAGYIGSVVTDKLIEENHNVVVIDNLCKGYKEAVNKEAKFYNMDLNYPFDLGVIFKRHDIDIVIHLAALSIVEESTANPKKYFKNNVNGMLNLLDAMLDCNVNKIIFSSSSTVYGNLNKPSFETSKLEPINPYGDSKLMCEQILHRYGNAYDLNSITFRYFNVAGATELRGQNRKPETSIIPCIIDSVVNKKPFKIYGTDYNTKDGTCVRDYLHVEDVAQAHLLAINKIKHSSNIFNLSSINGYSVSDVVNSAKMVLGDFEVIKCERRVGDSDILVSDSTAARTYLRWQPKYTNMEDIIKSAWDWRQKFPNGYKS